MKLAEINKTFLARNVYRRWQSMIEKAESEITIFTPYFDHTLLRLLEANSTVEQDEIRIITDISPDNALEMPYQLRAAKQALAQGLSVLSLQGLHAKVLLVDGNHTSIGSQNFTGRGKRNKEASVLPATMFGDSQFVQTLQEWRTEAREVTAEEIDELLQQLAPFFRKHKKMHDDIHAEVNEVLARQAEKREALLRIEETEREEKERKSIVLLREHLPELEQQSPIRIARHVVYATLRSRNDHKTLMVEDGGDLTNWENRNADGSFSPLSLNWLYFYPIIFADTNRMGFARIAKTRITYVRKAINWTNTQWMVGEVAADISITFPDTKTESQNIEASVTTADHGSCTFHMSFNGKSIEVRKRKFSLGERATPANHALFMANITNTLLDSKDELNKFFKYYLRPFKFTKIRLDHKNVEEYFDESWYRVSVIQAQGNPLLVFTKH